MRGVVNYGLPGHGEGIRRVSSSALDERLLATGDEAGTAPEDRRFRPDVEGLRAVAVGLVVFYHAGLSQLSGGFVGVDVFFVISGFVITGLLLRERQASGRTSILNFYARRFRRILPAATLVIFATVIASYLALGFVSGNVVANDGRWAAVFLSNFHFAAVGTNYFTAKLPPSPLQNFWSLSVEEQFYFVYPTLFFVIARLKGRWSLQAKLAVVLAAVIVASYWFSVTQTASTPTQAYFSPFTRANELALGALVAVGTPWLKRLPAALAAGLSWAGLGAIALAAVLFTAQTPYPGSAVALPVLGAALVIAGGVVAPRGRGRGPARTRALPVVGQALLRPLPVALAHLDHRGRSGRQIQPLARRQPRADPRRRRDLHGLVSPGREPHPALAPALADDGRGRGGHGAGHGAGPQLIIGTPVERRARPRA